MKLNVEPLWRKAYEMPAIIAWSIAGSMMLYASTQSGDLGIYPAAIAITCFFFAFVRACQVFILWEKKARLVHLEGYEMSRDEIMRTLVKAQKKARRGKLRVDE